MDGATPIAWVDSHCHLFMHEEDEAVLLERALAVGVEWLVAPGIDLESSLAARALAMRFPDRVRWTAGLHPHDAVRWREERSRIEALAVDAAGIGECGLDYYRNLSPREDQREALSGQFALAERLGIPIVLHCRDAFADLHSMVAAAALGERAVLHCWTGGPKWTRRFAEHGVTFSFAGPVTYPGGDTVRRAVAEVPPERTMVETDTPYLTPPPDRHLQNEPANVPLVGAAIAEVWGVDVGEVAKRSAITAARIFGSPRP
jgi:TatD DNase family protein